MRMRARPRDGALRHAHPRQMIRARQADLELERAIALRHQPVALGLDGAFVVRVEQAEQRHARRLGDAQQRTIVQHLERRHEGRRGERCAFSEPRALCPGGGHGAARDAIRELPCERPGAVHVLVAVAAEQRGLAEAAAAVAVADFHEQGIERQQIAEGEAVGPQQRRAQPVHLDARDPCLP